MTDQPSQNNSNTDRSRLDPGQIVQDIHVPEDNAIKIIKANNLVPREYSRIDLEYITAGPAKDEVSRATYYDTGVKQESSFFPRGDQQPSPEITVITMTGAIATNLSQKYFLLEDTGGKVAFFYALDGDLIVPSTGASRNVKIDILSTDSDAQITLKSQAVINGDIEFIASSINTFLTVTSSTNGNKLNAVDINTGFSLEIVDGVESDTLNNKYFFLYSPTTTYYVWYNIEGAGIDPAPGGIGIEIQADADSTSSQIQDATITELNKTRFFTAKKKEAAILVIANEAGETTDIQDGDTDFSHFTTVKNGVDPKIIRTIDLTYDALGKLIRAVGY